MKIKLIIIASLATLVFDFSCKPNCTGKEIYFGLIYANKSDTLNIYFDKKLAVSKIIKEDYTGHFQDRKDKLTTSCVNSDSMHVRVTVNNRDTLFYLHPKEVTECYIGVSMAGIIHVYYNYVQGGFREYDPKR
jgi:hypothetical protein